MSPQLDEAAPFGLFEEHQTDRLAPAGVQVNTKGESMSDGYLVEMALAFSRCPRSRVLTLGFVGNSIVKKMGPDAKENDH
jgi:hypothetical protein